MRLTSPMIEAHRILIRPSFSNSAAPDIALPLYELFVNKLKQSGLNTVSGQFGAMMKVVIENDGPVTIVLEK